MPRFFKQFQNASNKINKMHLYALKNSSKNHANQTFKNKLFKSEFLSEELICLCAHEMNEPVEKRIILFIYLFLRNESKIATISILILQ